MENFHHSLPSQEELGREGEQGRLSWVPVLFSRCVKMKTKLFKLLCKWGIPQDTSFYFPSPSQFWFLHSPEMTLQFNTTPQKALLLFGCSKMGFLP